MSGPILANVRPDQLRQLAAAGDELDGAIAQEKEAAHAAEQAQRHYEAVKARRVSLEKKRHELSEQLHQAAAVDVGRSSPAGGKASPAAGEERPTSTAAAKTTDHPAQALPEADPRRPRK